MRIDEWTQITYKLARILNICDRHLLGYIPFFQAICVRTINKSTAAQSGIFLSDFNMTYTLERHMFSTLFHRRRQ